MVTDICEPTPVMRMKKPIWYKTWFFLFVFSTCTWSSNAQSGSPFPCPSNFDPRGQLRATYLSEFPDKLVYFKIDQGVSYGSFSDQRMSALLYGGPGGGIAFGRHVRRPGYITEATFARADLHYTKPDHGGTIVYNPVFGMGYKYMRGLIDGDFMTIYLGGQSDLLANIRMAPSLGNSFLYADILLDIRPVVQSSLSFHFLKRPWFVDLGAGMSIMGYAFRFPDYGVGFEIGNDGSLAMQPTTNMMLHPFNYQRLTTSVHIRESFGGSYNPNWFRIGYVWDYYGIQGDHKLKTGHASHRLVLELYFMVN